MVGGTLPYMAPEHLDAFNPNGNTPPEAVDERSDIYALGLILFEMIAGQHPFPEPPPGRPLLEIVRLMTEERRGCPPSPRDYNPEVPRGLDAIVRKCLDPDPDRRHARAGDLAEDLRRFLDDRPLKFTPEPSLSERLAKWARRNPKITGATPVAVVSMVLIVAIAGSAWTLQRHLRQVSARVKYHVFERKLYECQFLLNISNGQAKSMGRGIGLAEEAIRDAGVATSSDRSRTWLSDLTPDEQVTMRSDLAELILLAARARVYQAERSKSEPKRRVALEEAIDRLDLAEKLGPQALASALRRPGALSRRAGRRRASRQRPGATRRDSPDHRARLLSARHLAALARPARPSRADPRQGDRARPPAVLGLVRAGALPLRPGAVRRIGRRLRYLLRAGAQVRLALDEPWAGPGQGQPAGRGPRVVRPGHRGRPPERRGPGQPRPDQPRPRRCRSRHTRPGAGHRPGNRRPLGPRRPGRSDGPGRSTGRRPPPALRTDRDRSRRPTPPNRPGGWSCSRATRRPPRSTSARSSPETPGIRSPTSAWPACSGSMTPEPRWFMSTSPSRETPAGSTPSSSALCSEPDWEIPTAVDDVDRLIQAPTPHRLYNSACALALLSESVRRPDPRPSSPPVARSRPRIRFPGCPAPRRPPTSSRLRSSPTFRKWVDDEAKTTAH